MDISVNNISFSYPKSDKQVLKNISFNAKQSEITSLIGANGAGKSTLMKSILGVLKADGQVLLGDKNINSFSRQELMRHVGYLTQENSFLSSLTVFEVIMLGRMHSLRIRVNKEEIDKVWAVMSNLGIEDLAERPFYALSGGQRRIVGLAQTIVKEPDVLILDEPTANLDIQNELEVLELIKTYTKKKNVTTLMILHDLNMASRFSDKLVLMNNNCIYSSGKPIDVITELSVREAYGVNVFIHVDKAGIPMIHLINSVGEKKYSFD